MRRKENMNSSIFRCLSRYTPQLRYLQKFILRYDEIRNYEKLIAELLYNLFPSILSVTTPVKVKDY